jgi:ferredoxin
VPSVSCRAASSDRLTKQLDVAAGETLWRALRRAGHPIAAACDGDGVCGHCAVRVVDGARALRPLRPARLERAVLAQHGAGSDARLSCLVKVAGEGLVVTTSYW